MISSRKEIRNSVLNTTRQENSQIGSLVNDFINLSLDEINDPGWAFPRKNFNHLWNFLRRKTTFTTSADTADYLLGRDVDRVAILRQTETPVRLRQVTDQRFFDLIPDPTETGNPRFYRLWEKEGVSTRLSSADTIDVVSDSASDAGDSDLAVTVEGYVGGIWTKETYQLNGTTKVTGSKTFQAREILVSKLTDTTGTITVSENSGGTTLVTLGPDERTARFSVITLYPTPSSAITMYLEFYTFIPHLENDSDSPLFHPKWHYVVRLGALAKVYQYLNKETDFLTTQNMYASAVRAMVASDKSNPDILTHLNPKRDFFPFIHIRRSEDAVTA